MKTYIYTYCKQSKNNINNITVEKNMELKKIDGIHSSKQVTKQINEYIEKGQKVEAIHKEAKHLKKTEKNSKSANENAQTIKTFLSRK